MQPIDRGHQNRRGTVAKGWLFCLALLLATGCGQTIRPSSPAAPLDGPTFSHALLDGVLRRFVDQEGRVDYDGLAQTPDALERYYGLVAAYSPDNHPQLFPDKASRLAYWINAYNAAVLKAVLAHYPIASVTDVEAPALFFFMPERSGFFYFQRLVFGGAAINLYDLEHDVIRRRFAEPRIHFALNCASGGCPRLPASAFSAAGLEAELERETRRFIAEPRNFGIDHERRQIVLSAIFDWYRDDFTDWYVARFPGREATLLAYIALYLPSQQMADLQGRAASYTLRFAPYDWGLNGQGTSAR